MDDALYCENGECRVLMFKQAPEREQVMQGTEMVSNCPGCGQFGRKKGK